MSNLRAIFWLSVTLLLSLATLWLQNRFGTRPAARTPLRGDRIVKSAFDPTALEMTMSDGPNVRLERTDGWRLAKPYRAAVDERIVLKLMDKLRALTVAEAVTESELLRFGRERADVGLDPAHCTITLSDADLRQTLTFGDSTPASNAVYAAVEGSDAVLILNGTLSAAEFSPETFRVREIFPQGPESVVSFAIRQAAGRVLSFVRAGETWRVGEKPASAGKVTDFLRQLSSARVIDFKWPTSVTNETPALTDAKLAGYGLDTDSAVAVTLKCTDGVDRRIAFGSVAENLAYALVQDGTAVVTVDAQLRAAAVQPEAAFADARVFPFEMSSVRSFALSQNGLDCIVARSADGLWRLDAPIAASAEPTIVQEILGRLLALSTADAATDGLRVTVNTNAVRLTVSPGRILGERRLEDLRSRQMVRFDPEGVKRLVITRGDGKPLSIVHDRESRAWCLEKGGSGVTDGKAVANLLAALNPLSAARVVSLRAAASDLRRYGFDAPFLTVAVDQDLEGAVRRNILIGAATKGGRYATVGSSDAVFLLPDKTVRILETELVAAK